LTCLRQVNATALQGVNSAIANADFFGVFVWVPVIDGTFIVERPIQTLSRGKANGVNSDGT
jgi:hypothetical protein